MKLEKIDNSSVFCMNLKIFLRNILHVDYRRYLMYNFFGGNDMLDCAIVCGYPANEDGTISYILQSRIDKAIELYKQGNIGYIIVSGGAVHNQYSEAKVMEKYAIKNGVPKEKIIIEDQAKSTYHNMMYADELMKQYHIKTCYVVTNSWHMIKAKYYAKKFHLNFQTMTCSKPQHMSYLKVICLHVYMPLQMLKMRLKGYK